MREDARPRWGPWGGQKGQADQTQEAYQPAGAQFKFRPSVQQAPDL